MIVEISGREYCKEIQDYVDDHPESMLFHTPAWLDVYMSTYGFEGRHFVALGDTGKIIGILPLLRIRTFWGAIKYTNAPFYFYASPLADDDETIRCIIQHIRRVHPEICLEIKSELSAGHSALLNSHLADTVSYYDYEVDLNGPYEEVVSRYKTQHRTNLRSFMRKFAHQSGQVDIQGSIVETKSFFDCMLRYYVRKLGILPQPLNLFSNLNRHLSGTSILFCTVRTIEGDASYQVFLLHKEMAYYGWGIQNIDHSEGKMALSIGLDHAINHLCVKGYKRLRLGTTLAENSGGRFYKERWGGQEVPIHVWKNNNPTSFNVSRPPLGFLGGLVRRMPTRICGWGSAKCVKYFG